MSVRKDYTTSTANMVADKWSRDIEMAMLRPRITSFGKRRKPTKWEKLLYSARSLPPYRIYRVVGRWFTRKLMNWFDISEGDWY